MNFVAADLGASSTRYCSDNGIISVSPNNMVFLPTMDVSLIQPDANDIESSLEVQIVKHETDNLGYFPANVLMGIMAEKHRNLDERPSVNSHKHVQRINYISAIVAAALSKIKFDLSDTLDLYLATPPIEVHDAEVAFRQGLKGTYTVTFPKYMGGTVVNFKVDDVYCYEESFMASTSFFFNLNGTPKDSNKKYLSGTVLSLDIGASTTDLAIIKNGRYLDKSGQTYRIGGNVARDNLTDLICQKYAIDLPIEDAEKTMAEGRLQLGNTYDDVRDLVDIAKADLAKQLTNYMQTYFKRVSVPIQMINAIVVSGGGSMQSQYANNDGEIVKTSEPMSYYVTKELVNWSSGTEVVEYGEEARFANVKGLFIRAKFNSIKKNQQTATSAQAVVTPVQAPVHSAPAATPVAPADTPVAPAATPFAPAAEVTKTADTPVVTAQ